MALHELESLREVDDVVDPGDGAVGGHQRHHDEPEPEEQIDLLVEEIDRQHALDGVAVDVAQLTHFEVAKRDAREALRPRPVLPARQRVHHARAVRVVVGGEEDVHEEQLADDVSDVHELRADVERGEVVAVLLAGHRPPATLGQPAPQPGEAAALLVAIVSEIARELVHDVRHRLLALLRVAERQRRLDDVVQADARTSVQRAPDDARSEEEESLHDQHHVHPLVVADLTAVRRRLRLRDVLVERQVVGVRHPADLARVVGVSLREVAGHPALDLVADVLARTDDDGEDDEHDRRVVVVEAVDDVVVAELARRRQLRRREEAEDLRHLRGLSSRL